MASSGIAAQELARRLQPQPPEGPPIGQIPMELLAQTARDVGVVDLLRMVESAGTSGSATFPSLTLGAARGVVGQGAGRFADVILDKAAQGHRRTGTVEQRSPFELVGVPPLKGRRLMGQALQYMPARRVPRPISSNEAFDRALTMLPALRHRDKVHTARMLRRRGRRRGDFDSPEMFQGMEFHGDIANRVGLNFNDAEPGFVNTETGEFLTYNQMLRFVGED